MKFPEVCIRHPVFSVVLSILLIVVGCVSLRYLTIRYFPKFEQHTATISSSIPGASSMFMYNEVTKVIEHAITSVSGITNTFSSSHDNGTSTITVTIDGAVDYYAVVERLRNKVAGLHQQLPEMETPPSVSDNAGINWHTVPVLNFGFFSDTLTLEQLDEYIRNIIIPRLNTLPGVGGVPRYGEPGKTLWIWLDPIKMAQLHITATDVVNAIGNNNLTITSGSIISIDKKYALVSDTLLKSPEEFSEIVIQYKNNQPIYVRDIAKVQWGGNHFTPQNIYINGKQGIALLIRPYVSANPIYVAKDVLEVMQDIEKKLPESIKVKKIYNQATFIQKAMNKCVETLIEAIILVIFVTLVFLGSFRSAIIPITTIPVCIIASFGVMAFFGFTLNVVSLLALVLAIGLVVDDAIIVVENTYRHIEEGKKPFDAAILSSKELIFPIIAMTLTLVAVYIPIGLANGFTATVFREFSFTLAGAVMISGFVALTLSPMMCAYLLKPITKKSKFSLLFTSKIQQCIHRYSQWFSAHLEKKTGFFFTIICLIFGSFIYTKIGHELVPKEDSGYVASNIIFSPGANQNYINKGMSHLDKYLLQEKEFANVLSFYISGPTNFITLTPWEKRKRSAQQLVNDISYRLDQKLPSMQFSLNLPDPVDYGVGSTGFILYLTTLNQKMIPEDLKKLSDTVVEKLSHLRELKNIKSTLVYNTEQIEFQVKRELASKLGIQLSDIQNSLAIMMGGAPRITQIKAKDGESFSVRAQLNKQYLGNFNVLQDIYIKTQNQSETAMVPLSELLIMNKKSNTPSIETYQKSRSATITATTMPGYSLSDIEKKVNDIVRPLLTRNQDMFFGGSIQQMNISKKNTIFLFLLALLFIYLILAAQFESFIDPCIIMLTVPFTMIGALFALWMTGETLNVYSNIGLVTLIGLITKHGVLIVQCANRFLDNHMDIREAIITAVKIRMRPILMTSSAMIFGVLPLIFASGPGSVGRMNIGIVLFSGLVVGTIFSLFVVPTAYFACYKYQAKDVLKTLFSKFH